MKHDGELVSAKRLLDSASSVAVLTGAGISTDSGIPDFRGPKGLWTQNPEAEKLSHIDTYVASAQHRRAKWRRLVEVQSKPIARPNVGHRALVELERRGTLHTLVTQNVDGLHLEAGSSIAKVVEIHGSVRRAKCLGCGDETPIEAALERVTAGDDDPDCRHCGAMLKAATVSFGQSLDPDKIERAYAASTECDLLLAIGTTLAVYPIANMIPVARSHDADVVIINAEPTALDHLASVVLSGSIGDLLPRLVDRSAAPGQCL